MGLLGRAVRVLLVGLAGVLPATAAAQSDSFNVNTPGSGRGATDRDRAIEGGRGGPERLPGRTGEDGGGLVWANPGCPPPILATGGVPGNWSCARPVRFTPEQKRASDEAIRAVAAGGFGHCALRVGNALQAPWISDSVVDECRKAQAEARPSRLYGLVVTCWDAIVASAEETAAARASFDAGNGPEGNRRLREAAAIRGRALTCVNRVVPVLHDIAQRGNVPPVYADAYNSNSAAPPLVVAQETGPPTYWTPLMIDPHRPPAGPPAEPQGAPDTAGPGPTGPGPATILDRPNSECYPPGQADFEIWIEDRPPTEAPAPQGTPALDPCWKIWYHAWRALLERIREDTHFGGFQQWLASRMGASNAARLASQSWCVRYYYTVTADRRVIIGDGYQYPASVEGEPHKYVRHKLAALNGKASPFPALVPAGTAAADERTRQEALARATRTRAIAVERIFRLVYPESKSKVTLCLGEDKPKPPRPARGLIYPPPDPLQARP